MSGYSGDPPLMTEADAAALLGLTLPLAAPVDAQFTFAMKAVTSAIRRETGRYLTQASFEEAIRRQPVDWGTGLAGPPHFGLNEWPVQSITEIATLDGTAVPSALAAVALQKSVGRFWFTEGEAWPAGRDGFIVKYVGGFDPIPEDLQAVFLDLVRMQLTFMGVDLGALGGSAVDAAPVKAVTVGPLKVDYAVPTMSGSRATSPLTEEAMEPYAWTLGQFKGVRQFAATII